MTRPRSLPVLRDSVDELELDRRELMKLLAAGAALATGALGGCMQSPTERIMPRAEQPPELTPGIPVAYATSMVLDGFATGLLVQTHEARPTKVEGNPDHPASLGATNAFHQASVLDLYDPTRAKSALEHGAPTSLESLLRSIAFRERIEGLWFLLEPTGSPLVGELLDRVRARHRGARIAWYSPSDRRAVYEGARLAFGQPLEARYKLANTDVIVSLDGDFAGAMPNSVRWARDFAGRRRITGPGDDMPRLYIAEPRPSPTGTLADHALPLRASRIPLAAAVLLALVRGEQDPRAGQLSLRERRWLASAARDLTSRRGRGLVLAGDRQPAIVHALVHAINAAIDALGSTVELAPPALLEPLGDGLPELLAALRANTVHMLVAVDANPVYSAASVELPELLARVHETIYIAASPNETSRHFHWFVPHAHYMEAWGDARAFDGTISIVQPMIRPLYESVGTPELLAAFAGDPTPSAHRMLRDRYAPAGDSGEPTWRHILQTGLVPSSAITAIAVEANQADVIQAASSLAAPPIGFELVFERSRTVGDGEFAGNAWLQELPSPVEKTTWGNVAILSPTTARELGVEHGDVIQIAVYPHHVELPVYVLPGHADGCATVELGYGRREAGPVGTGVGVDVYPLRAGALGPFVLGATINRTGARRDIAATQQQFDQHGREVAPATTLAAYRANPELTAHLRGPLPSWLDEQFAGTPAWGMTIDTSICTGCSSCVVACQAENNIPVVGRTGVIRNREMHWLRIDSYREVRGDDVAVVNQPMLCQHCEAAPCEYVCPTYATQHSPDGLNEMVYNRCIGTRFCSNNCPYKVRRFNWFDYTENTAKTRQLQFNPSVTVRGRGVMEKCTFCVQRIRGAEIEARKQKRAIAPGEVKTACQQACPMGAIEFGLLSHVGMPVVEWRREPRSYAVLHELGTRPRTMYLAKVTNPGAEGDRG